MGPVGWGKAQRYEQGSENVQIIDLIARDPARPTRRRRQGKRRAQDRGRKTGAEITSARIRSDIDEIGAHGYYEVRAKLPSESGRGPRSGCQEHHPGAWWPDTGEIDLVEWSSALDYADNHISSALHFRGTPEQQPSLINPVHEGPTSVAR